MSAVHVLCRGPTDLYQDRNIFHGTRPFNACRIHVGKPQILKTATAQVGIISNVEEIAAQISRKRLCWRCVVFFFGFLQWTVESAVTRS